MKQPAGVERWLPAARAGSSTALGQLLEACRGYLILLAQKELEPDLQAKGGASDLVQETFLEAQRDFDKFHGQTEDQLLAWLRRLLLNNAVDFARHYRGTDKRQVSRETPPPSDSTGGSGLALTSAMPTPSHEAMANEEAQELLQAIDRLPEDYRLVLRLRYLEDRSFADVAQLMNRSPNAIRKLWARAVECLQQEWEKPS